MSVQHHKFSNQHPHRAVGRLWLFIYYFYIFYDKSICAVGSTGYIHIPDIKYMITESLCGATFFIVLS